MTTPFNSDTISRTWPPPLGGPVTSSAHDSNMQPSIDHGVAPPALASVSKPGLTYQPVDDVDPLMPSTCHFTLETPQWQKDLDAHFTNVFKESVLSVCPMDTMVARTMQIIESPTQAKMRGLALTICTHWTRMQFRCKNVNVYTREIVALISRIANHLGQILVHAQKDFLDELNRVCFEKLKLTWHWYVAVVIPGALTIPRNNMFMRVMAAVTMISHLFHGGQLRYGVVLDCLGCFTTMLPWPDAVAIIYALLHRLGSRFALEQAGWLFIQHLLSELFPFTVGRAHVDPLCQLVSALNTLAAEWHGRSRVILYHTHKESN